MEVGAAVFRGAGQEGAPWNRVECPPGLGKALALLGLGFLTCSVTATWMC